MNFTNISNITSYLWNSENLNSDTHVHTNDKVSNVDEEILPIVYIKESELDLNNTNMQLIQQNIDYDNFERDQAQLFAQKQNASVIDNELHNNEAYTTHKLKQEEFEELTKLLQDLDTLKSINKDLLSIVGEHTQNIYAIEEDIINTNDIIELSNVELLETNKLKIEQTGTKITVTTVGTTIVGAVAVSVAGIKIGLILGAVVLFGGTVWSVWPEKILDV